MKAGLAGGRVSNQSPDIDVSNTKPTKYDKSSLAKCLSVYTVPEKQSERRDFDESPTTPWHSSYARPRELDSEQTRKSYL